jgi:hypothetical protein
MNLTHIKARRDVLLLILMACYETFHKDAMFVNRIEGGIAALDTVIHDIEKGGC